VGLGARSLPALRAFLQAEQYYRRGLWDSAQVYAEQAVALDTTFALAYKRLAQSIGWQGGDSLATVYALRAGALNHGLAPRDSLLVLAESLFRPLHFGGTPSPVLGARALATLEQATQRYPDSPDAWSALGEVRHHLGGWLVPAGWGAALEAFERSIALDSLFAPAYVHPVELSYALGDSARERRFAKTLIRLNPRSTRGLQAVQQLISLRDTAAQARILDTLPQEVLSAVYGIYGMAFARGSDSAELGLRVLRHSLQTSHAEADVEGARLSLAWALAYRGHVREALTLSDTTWQIVFAEAALLCIVPAEQAAARFKTWLRRPSPDESALALAWWGARADTVALRRFLQLADSAARASRSAADSFWAPPWGPLPGRTCSRAPRHGCRAPAV
jgi:eukaryotic-like serine/threonine-protein kinase